MSSNLINPTIFILFIYYSNMAYVKRPATQSAEFFRPDVYVNFRSTDSVNEETSEIKKG